MRVIKISTFTHACSICISIEDDRYMPLICHQEEILLVYASLSAPSSVKCTGDSFEDDAHARSAFTISASRRLLATYQKCHIKIFDNYISLHMPVTQNILKIFNDSIEYFDNVRALVYQQFLSHWPHCTDLTYRYRYDDYRIGNSYYTN